MTQTSTEAPAYIERDTYTGRHQNKKDILADQIVEALEAAGWHEPDLLIATVEVGEALMPVETVEAYGLTIKLDAMGEASEISSARGLAVVE